MGANVGAIPDLIPKILTQNLKSLRMADGVGFEPTRSCLLAVFKTAAFNRSATHPHEGGLIA